MFRPQLGRVLLIAIIHVGHKTLTTRTRGGRSIQCRLRSYPGAGLEVRLKGFGG